MKKWNILLAIFVFVVAIFFIFNLLNNADLKLIRPELILGKNFFTSLENTISPALEGTKGTYAIVVKNMKTGEQYSKNADTVFEPGSLYKLWVMGTVFDKISKGEIREDEILSEDASVLNQKFEIEEGEAEITEGEISMSTLDALNQMITISHNYAALLLSDRVQNSQIKKFLQDNGFNNSDLGSPPKTTAADIALFFEKLYKGEIVNPDSSGKMIALLKGQTLNDGLPKQLPQDLEVAHKTGDIGWFKHDTGIVYTPKGDYIIVVLSQSDSPSGAQERIAQVSKAVYDYFTK